MKVILYIGFILSGFAVFGQEWRDSLDIARDAYKKENYSKALKYYESAQKKAPENVDLSDEMAQSAYKAREFETAEKIYQQSGNSKKTAQQKAANYHNLGNARMKKKDYQGAIDAYKESLRANPNDDNTRYNLSEAIRQLKNQQQQEQKQQNQQNDQSQQQNQDQQQQQKQQQKNNQNNKQEQSQNSEGKPKEQGKSQLPNKTVDKMLDKLTKDEAETKRKVNGSGGKNSSSTSGKDW